jgi:hypothetical protein
VDDTEQIAPVLYYVDSNGEYHKCHKLLPDIRRIFGEIEYLDGEPVEIIPNNKERKMNINGPVVDVYHERVPENGVLNETWNDKKNQTTATKVFAKKMDCKVHTYPQLWPVDGYAFKGRDVLGMLEIKGASKVRDIGYLNLRKYMNLRDATRISSNNIPGFFVIYDDDGLHWIDVKDIGVTIEVKMAIVGYIELKSPADIEPAFQIKKSDMKHMDV